MNTYPSINNYPGAGYKDTADFSYTNNILVNEALITQQIVDADIKALAQQLSFRAIMPEDMTRIFELLKLENGRTTDFSYGGILMWVEPFDYQFAIVEETLFIRGHVENDFSKYAFSLPVGKMDIKTSVAILNEYCRINDTKLIFSAVPEYALADFEALQPQHVELIENMGDYLYSAEKLSTLSGKKYSKKRNHVNQFLSAYPNWYLEPLTAENAQEALNFMTLIDKEGDDVPMAIIERKLNRRVLRQIEQGDKMYVGAILRSGDGTILGYTVGTIKGDTLFVHIEKALRDAPGAFEMINKAFAQKVCELHPEIEYINREDDSGDPGLRYAKQSYHPIEILQKYNVVF